MLELIGKREIAFYAGRFCLVLYGTDIYLISFRRQSIKVRIIDNMTFSKNGYENNFTCIIQVILKAFRCCYAECAKQPDILGAKK